MPSRFFRIEIVHASDESSASGLSAYISRDRRYGVTGRLFDFTKRRAELVDRGMIVPDNVPAWAADPDKLWREAERMERTVDRKTGEDRWKKTAQVAKHFIIALPRELTDEDRRDLLQQFIQHELRPQDHGVAVEWAIHRDEQNPHAHVIISTRSLGPDGFGKKARGMNSESWRAGAPRNDTDWDEVRADFQKAFIKKRYGAAAAQTVRDRAHQRRDRYSRADPHREAKAQKFAQADRLIRRAQRLNPLVALQELTRYRGVFGSDDLLRYCQSLEITGDEAAAFVQTVLNHAKCIELYDHRGQIVGWTHADLRKMERAVLRQANLWARRIEPGIEFELAAARMIGLRGGLSDEQRQALLEMVGKRFSLLRGRAGTGKSTTLNALRDTFELRGYAVIALAPTNTVVSDLKESGFSDARTIHSALARLKRGTLKWNSRTVIIVDEAAMIDTKLMHRLFEAVLRTGARLVLCGDDRQFASVEAGGMFAEFVRCCGGPELKTVYRQRDRWQAEASENLAAGEIAKALRAYHAAGRVVFVDTIEEARARAAADGADFIYASTNREVEALNLAIQARRRGGRIPTDCTRVTTCRGEFTISAGERVQFYATDHKLGCVTSEFGTVIAATPAQITIQKDDGAIVTFNPRTFDKWGLGYAGTAYKGQGKTQERVACVYDSKLAWNERAAYVIGTRHREDFTMYVPRDLAADIDALIAEITAARPYDGASTRYRTREELDPEIKPSRTAGPAFSVTQARIDDLCNRERRRLWAKWYIWKRGRIEAREARDWGHELAYARNRIEELVAAYRVRLEAESRRPFANARAEPRPRPRPARPAAGASSPGVG